MSFAPNSHHITSFVSYSRLFRWVQQRPITHDTTIKRRVAHQWRVVAPLDKHIGCWHKMMSNIRFLLIRFYVYRFLRLPRSFFFLCFMMGTSATHFGVYAFCFWDVRNIWPKDLIWEILYLWCICSFAFSRLAHRHHYPAVSTRAVPTVWAKTQLQWSARLIYEVINKVDV